MDTTKQGGHTKLAMVVGLIGLGAAAMGCARRPYAASAADVSAWARASNVLDPNGRPNFGGGELTSGFQPDPWTFPLTAGGGRNPVNIADFAMRDSLAGTLCGRSFVTHHADFHFTFRSSVVFDLLRFYVVAENEAVDPTLVVHEPNGHWRCNDDHGHSGWGHAHMPALDFDHPAPGRYAIWVGSFDASANNRAQLYVTELTANHP